MLTIFLFFFFVIILAEVATIFFALRKSIINKQIAFVSERNRIAPCLPVVPLQCLPKHGRRDAKHRGISASAQPDMAVRSVPERITLKNFYYYD